MLTRQQMRAQERADAFRRVNAAYGLEPRRARRGIALVWARKEWRRRAAVTTLSCGLLALSVFSPVGAFGQSSRYDNVVLRSGMGMGGANVAVCTTLATTAASVSANLAVLTMASNPVTAGFVANTQVTVSGFTGGDTYFNGTFTILSVSPTTIVYALVHANASASSNGTAFQTGNATVSCAPLATIYTDITGLTPTTNPFTADGLGNYGFWAPPGLYSVQIYGPGITTKVSLVTVSGNVIGQFSTQILANGAAYPTVQAAINSLPSTGGWVSVPPGTFACPTSIPSHVHLTGYISGIPAATITAAGNLVWGTPPADQKTIFTCTGNLTLSGMWDTTIEGITFDFGSTNNGIILQNGIFNNTFDIVIQNCGTGTALTLNGGSVAGQSVSGNIFKRLFVFNAGKGVRLLATAPGVASNNYFDYVFQSNIASLGVEFVNQADSNQFNWLFQSLNNNANGISFNTLTPGSDTGANGNKILNLIQDGMNGASYVGTLVTINKSSGNQILSWSVGGGLTNGTELTVTNNPSFSVSYAVDYTTPANNNKTQTGAVRINAYDTNFPLLLNNPGGGTSGLGIQSGGVTRSSIQDNLSSHNMEFYDAGNTLLFQMLQGGGVGVPTYADVTEIAAPASPSAGKERWYADSTAHTLSCIRNGGSSCVPGGLPVGTIVSGSDITLPGNVRIKGGDPYWDITASGASGSINATTATCTAATTTCTLAAAIDFKNNQYIHIAGAGASSLPYFGQITAGAGTTTITVSPAIGTSVAGATASHDDIPAINAAVDACTASFLAGGGNGGGGPIFFPAGTFQQKSGPVHHHSAACPFSGPPGSKLSADLAVWNGTGSYGPTLVSTGAFSVSTYMAIASFPAALLTGSGTAFGMNSNNGAFNARDCKVCAELNGLTGLTMEGTFNFSSLTGQKMALIASSGKRDSVQGQQTAAMLQTDAGNHAVCTINVGGTARTVTDAAALTTGSNIHLACDYDHANVRLFKNGTSVGTPVAVVGAVVQAPLEEVGIGAALGDFPENYTNNAALNATTGVTADGIRISNVARYTSNFTAPTAKWTLAQVDANTLLQLDFDSQPDVFTVGYTSNGGSTPFPVYLPYHRSVCGGGVDNFHVSNLTFGDASGRNYDGIYFSGGSGWILENLFFNTGHNGILTDGCDFDYHVRDVELSGNGNARYLMALNNGIGLLDNVHSGGSAVSLVLPGNGVYNHLFLSPSGPGGPDLVSILIKSAGAQTIGGVKPTTVLNNVQADIEAAISGYQTVLMLDQVGSAQLNGGDYECGAANTTCQPITINGGGAVQINGAGISANAAAASLIHVPSPLPNSPIMLNGIQNPINLPLTDAGTTIVCGGTGSGSVSGCSMPTYSTSTNCAVNSVSPAACGSSAAGAFVVPTTTTTYTVNTTAVLGTTSRIFLTPLTFAANLPSSPTCVAPAAGAVTVSAVVANTSFTFALPSTTGQSCWQYHIMN